MIVNFEFIIVSILVSYAVTSATAQTERRTKRAPYTPQWKVLRTESGRLLVPVSPQKLRKSRFSSCESTRNDGPSTGGYGPHPKMPPAAKLLEEFFQMRYLQRMANQQHIYKKMHPQTIHVLKEMTRKFVDLERNVPEAMRHFKKLARQRAQDPFWRASWKKRWLVPQQKKDRFRSMMNGMRVFSMMPLKAFPPRIDLRRNKPIVLPRLRPWEKPWLDPKLNPKPWEPRPKPWEQKSKPWEKGWNAPWNQHRSTSVMQSRMTTWIPKGMLSGNYPVTQNCEPSGSIDDGMLQKTRKRRKATQSSVNDKDLMTGMLSSMLGGSILGKNGINDMSVLVKRRDPVSSMLSSIMGKDMQQPTLHIGHMTTAIRDTPQIPILHQGTLGTVTGHESHIPGHLQRKPYTINRNAMFAPHGHWGRLPTTIHDQRVPLPTNKWFNPIISQQPHLPPPSPHSFRLPFSNRFLPSPPKQLFRPHYMNRMLPPPPRQFVRRPIMNQFVPPPPMQYFRPSLPATPGNFIRPPFLTRMLPSIPRQTFRPQFTNRMLPPPPPQRFVQPFMNHLPPLMPRRNFRLPFPNPMSLPLPRQNFRPSFIPPLPPTSSRFYRPRFMNPASAANLPQRNFRVPVMRTAMPFVTMRNSPAPTPPSGPFGYSAIMRQRNLERLFGRTPHVYPRIQYQPNSGLPNRPPLPIRKPSSESPKNTLRKAGYNFVQIKPQFVPIPSAINLRLKPKIIKIPTFKMSDEDDSDEDASDDDSQEDRSSRKKIKPKCRKPVNEKRDKNDHDKKETKESEDDDFLSKFAPGTSDAEINAEFSGHLPIDQEVRMKGKGSIPDINLELKSNLHKSVSIGFNRPKLHVTEVDTDQPWWVKQSKGIVKNNRYPSADAFFNANI